MLEEFLIGSAMVIVTLWLTWVLVKKSPPKNIPRNPPAQKEASSTRPRQDIQDKYLRSPASEFSIHSCRKAPPSIRPHLDMRDLVLRSPASEFSIDPSPRGEWGCLMETGYIQGATTLVCLADGTTSLYSSTGGGMIGAGQHPQVAQESMAFAQMAGDYRSEMTLVQRFPLPKANRVRFYLLTTDGVYSMEALQDDLGYNRHAMSPLFHAAHRVITLIRLLSEQQK